MRSDEFNHTVALRPERLVRLLREKAEEQLITNVQNISYEQ
jgi:hypothetical protein